MLEVLHQHLSSPFSTVQELTSSCELTQQALDGQLSATSSLLALLFVFGLYHVPALGRHFATLTFVVLIFWVSQQVAISLCRGYQDIHFGSQASRLGSRLVTRCLNTWKDWEYEEVAYFGILGLI